MGHACDSTFRLSSITRLSWRRCYRRKIEFLATTHYACMVVSQLSSCSVSNASAVDDRNLCAPSVSGCSMPPSSRLDRIEFARASHYMGLGGICNLCGSPTNSTSIRRLKANFARRAVLSGDTSAVERGICDDMADFRKHFKRTLYLFCTESDCVT